MNATTKFFHHRYAQHHLMLSVRLALFGAVLPLGLAQSANAKDIDSPSLERLSGYYQAKPNAQARCQGVWIHPSHQNQKSLAEELGITKTNTDHTQNETNKTASDSYFAQADYGYYDNHEYAELSGNVILEQNGQQVLADKITFNPKTGESHATGQVVFGDNPANILDKNQTAKKDVGMIGVAEELNYNAQAMTATAKDVAFASTAIGAHGHAKQLQKVDSSHYKMDDVMFSTCPPTERKWHLDADSIDINSDTGRAIAKNSTLKIKNVPILYLPYFNFPIDERRASGFLLPKLGLNANGLELTTPYYLNLAPNFDATLSPTIFSNRNPMLTAEFRYLTEKFGQGRLEGSFLPQDKKHDKQHRHHVFFDHDWQSKRLPALSAYATYRHVSDSDYLTDFDTLGLENNPLNLPRRIGANYHTEYLQADLRAETFQTLDGTKNDGTPILDKDKPYSRLPQLAINYTLPKSTTQAGQKLGVPALLDKINIQGVHNTAYFKKSIKDNSDTEKSGVRMYNQLSASYTALRSWGYFTPKLSLNHLHAYYDEDSLGVRNLDKKNGSYLVIAPQISLDSGVFFEKSGSPFGWFDQHLGGYQVLSPRLKYNYTPYKDQSRIPNFETAISAISYDQLLSDSWFLGYDRIQDLHAITPAISYRYIDKNGVARFDGGIAQQFYLNDLKVGIADSQAYSERSSGMAWKMSAKPLDSVSVEAGGSFNHNHKPNHVTAQIRYQPNEQSLYSIGMIDRKQNLALGQLPLQAYTAAAIFPISNRFRVLGQVQYDQKNTRLLDALVGVNYEDCCYGLSVYARRYRNSLNPEAPADTAIMAEIRLNGITGEGRLNRLMSDKVQGYDTAQDAWRRAY